MHNLSSVRNSVDTVDVVGVETERLVDLHDQTSRVKHHRRLFH